MHHRLSTHPPACVQVDLDGLWAVLDHFGETAAQDPDPLYRQGLPRFLDLFARYGVRATFFVVGRDLSVPWKLGLLEQAVGAGHEAASHSLTHPRRFGRLTPDGLRAELEGATEAIRTRLGRGPVGFRAPQYAFRADSLPVLAELGYLYDASLLPVFPAPLWGLAKAALSGGKLDRRDYLLNAGPGRAGLWPGPAGADRDSEGRASKLWELPVTPFPFLRFPFHASYLLAAASVPFASSRLLELGLAILHKARTPVSYVFHLLDLADPLRDPRLRGHPGAGASLETRLSLCTRILEALLERFSLMPAADLAAGLAAGRESDVPDKSLARRILRKVL